MAQPTQFPAAALPAKLISHILDLVLEGLLYNPVRERRDLFLFGKVCRTWYLATLAWTRFVVTLDSSLPAPFLTTIKIPCPSSTLHPFH